MTDTLRSRIVEIIESEQRESAAAMLKAGVTNYVSVVPERLADRILSLIQQGEWQPIETAPRDGTLVMLALPRAFSSNDLHGYAPWSETAVLMGWHEPDYEGNDWRCCFMEDGAADTEGFSFQFFMGVKPTHWRPLPAPPLSKD